MNLALIEIETLEKLFEEIADLKRTVFELSKKSTLADGEVEWEYYTLNQALELLGISKKSWYKSYKNIVPRPIPYAQYGDRVWIKKTDIKLFIEKRKLK